MCFAERPAAGGRGGDKKTAASTGCRGVGVGMALSEGHFVDIGVALLKS